MLQQFLLHNLLPALLAGTLAWMVVVVGIRLFRIRYAPLQLCLLSVPLINSTLVLFGFLVVLRWPRDLFETWQAEALDSRVVLLGFVAWSGAALAVRRVLTRRSTERLISQAKPAISAAPRLVAALERVTAAWSHEQEVASGCCTVMPSLVRPALLVVDDDLRSPIAFTAGQATILFPSALVARLSDDELDGAVAHELAHLGARRSPLCSTPALGAFVAVNPMVALLASHMRDTEERACDDVAVGLLQRPETYAEMLVKCYRYATERAARPMVRLEGVASLLGLKPTLSTRVERLLHRPMPETHLGLQCLASGALWIGLSWLFFQA